MQKRKINVVLASGMALMLLSGSMTTVANAATDSNIKVESTKKSPYGIQYQTQGDLKLSGTAMDGLELIDHNRVTRNSLGFHYKVSSLASINWGDRTFTTIKLPKELDKLADSGKLTKYIDSGHFSYRSSTGSLSHDYDPSEIKVSKDIDGTHYLKLENPRITGIGVNTEIEVSFNFDIGAAVTDTGIRIPHAINKFSYDFEGTIAPEGEIIDWELVGNTNGADKIPVEILDPGYDLLQLKPTIDEPVTDTDTEILGAGYPGAEVRAIVNGNIVGNTTVNPSGIYRIKLNAAKSAGTVITVIQNTGVGDSQPAKAIVQKNPERPDQPIINGVENNKLLVTTKALSGILSGDDKNDSIVVRGEFDSVDATVGRTGAWRALMPEGFLYVGETIDIVQIHKTSDGKVLESKPVTLTVVDHL